jgi:AhpD family alkylhydroperoxidase
MKLLLTMLILMTFSISGIVIARTVTSTNPEYQKTYEDIQKTLGQVPTFFKGIPESSLPAAWEEMKNVELSSSTVLPGRVKELIGLAVAAQIPCAYCIYFHTEAAKMNGASDAEIKEALSMAAISRHWSTYINGIQYNEVDFRKDTDKVVATMKENMSRALDTKTTSESPEQIVVTDSASAYKDIEKTLGSVPGFLRAFPEESISGVWKMMKSIEINPETELSSKTKELIALAVDAQVPCRECAYMHTETAKINGASTLEINEAVAMASNTRFWSTVLNGSQTDEKTFRKEVSQIMKHVKYQSTKKVGMTAITKSE